MDDIVSIPKDSGGAGVSVYSGFDSIVTGPANSDLFLSSLYLLFMHVFFLIP